MASWRPRAQQRRPQPPPKLLRSDGRRRPSVTDTVRRVGNLGVHDDPTMHQARRRHYSLAAIVFRTYTAVPEGFIYRRHCHAYLDKGTGQPVRQVAIHNRVDIQSERG